MDLRSTMAPRAHHLISSSRIVSNNSVLAGEIATIKLSMVVQPVELVPYPTTQVRNQAMGSLYKPPLE